MKRCIGLANTVSTESNGPALKERTRTAIGRIVDTCRVERKRTRAIQTATDLSDEAVCKASRWTDRLPLADYDSIIHLVPRLVNVVTVRIF
jgi:phosphohistidine phosphatase SixA